MWDVTIARIYIFISFWLVCGDAPFVVAVLASTLSASTKITKNTVPPSTGFT